MLERITTCITKNQVCLYNKYDFFLKQTCGYEFTGKLARMFQDIKVSDDLNIEFFDYVKSELSSTTQHQTMTNLIGLDFNIYVLQVKAKKVSPLTMIIKSYSFYQANSWPVASSPINTFILPHILEKPLHMV
jgi:hypothetical protein